MLSKSILTDDIEHCFLCGRYGVEEHHCIHGTSNRKNSEKYNLVVPLCRGCHSRLHDRGEYDDELKKAAQVAFECEHSREDFINIFGKSYV